MGLPEFAPAVRRLIVRAQESELETFLGALKQAICLNGHAFSAIPKVIPGRAAWQLVSLTSKVRHGEKVRWTANFEIRCVYVLCLLRGIR